MLSAVRTALHKHATVLVFAAGALVLVATRLTHAAFLWPDDTLPLGAAYEVRLGKALYRDVWFDKPPLVAAVNLFWGALPGVPLRLAGALYFFSAAIAAFACATVRWGRREGLFAALLTLFFATFALPSAVIPLGADSLLLLPHVVAMLCAWLGRPFWSGVAAGVGLLINSKAVFVLAACSLFLWGQLPGLIVGFLVPNLLALAYLASSGSLGDYYREVWQWGSIYAAHTFVSNPWKEGALRTLHWLGFHAALVWGAAFALGREPDRRRWLLWMALAFWGVTLGLRFFPRYYFLLLAPLLLMGARGAVALRGRPVLLGVMGLLLLVPLIRFGPRYAVLAHDELLGHLPQWSDIAIDQDSRQAATLLRAGKRPGDTLFVWGFRAELFVYAEMPSATRFLESQPLNGVLADRALFSEDSLAPWFTRPNQEEALRSRPSFVVDGLALLNPQLAMRRNPAFASWLDQYEEINRTRFSVVYRRRSR